jgi:hypothetical protein
MEQKGIFISYEKRRELANAIQRVVSVQEGSLSYVLKEYMNEILHFPEYLYPLLPKKIQVPLSESYVLSDRIREFRCGRTYKLCTESEIWILYSHSNKIADAVAEYDNVKASAIREMPSFDWVKLIDDVIKLKYGELKYRRYGLLYAFEGFRFNLEYIPYERLDYVALSEITYESKNEKREIQKIEYHYDHTRSFPIVYINTIDKNGSGGRTIGVYSPETSVNRGNVREVSLELYPMADKLTEILRDMETGLDIYKIELEKRLNRLKDITAMYKFKKITAQFQK